MSEEKGQKLNPSCIFCKIIQGQIPSFKIYEDDLTYAFFDINPLSRAHCLVIPKYCAVRCHELPEDVMAAVGRTLNKVAKAVVKATGLEDYNILQNNGEIAHQVVMHVHFHIIPKPDSSRGLGVGWPATQPDKADLAELTKAIQTDLVATL